MRSPRRHAPAGLLLFFLVWIAMPGPAGSQPAQLRFQHLSVDDGLSQNGAAAIAQDDLGFLWFATEDGLNRYDGYDFTVFAPDPDNPAAIGHNFINALITASDGTLWAGSRGGLHRFWPATQSFDNYRSDPDRPGSLPDDNVTVLLEDASEGIWIGTERGGLVRFNADNQGFEHYPTGEESLASLHITAVVQVPDGRLLVGTRAGLGYLDPLDGSFQPWLTAHPMLAGLAVTALAIQAEGSTWIGTENGLFRWTGADLEAYQEDPGNAHALAHHAVSGLFVDANDRLWIGTRGGLSIWTGDGGFHTHRHQQDDPSSVGGDDVVSFYEDANGTIWVGQDGSGISRTDPLGTGFSHLGVGLDHPDGTVHPHVWAILVDSRDELWVGSEASGLSHFRADLGRFEHFLMRPDDPRWLGSNHVNAIIEDDRGVVWIGTDFAGLHRYDRNTREFQRMMSIEGDPNSLSDNNIYSLLEDRRNFLWVATNNGVSRLDPRRRRFTRFAHDPNDPATLSDAGARSMLEAADGSIWVGTRRGLNRIDPLSGLIERITTGIGGDQALARHWVLSLNQGEDGTLWIGTTQGLYRLAPDGQVSVTTQRDGLPNDVIYGILIDPNGRLWMSTNRGIAALDPETGDINSYDVSHGLQANEFNQGAYHQDRSGQMLFGGINGITAFRPDAIARDPSPPPVVLTDFLLFNQPVPVSSPRQPTPLTAHVSMLEQLVLDHQQSVFTIDFTAIHFQEPANIRYSYRLLGLGEDWIETNARRRSATFTALPAGSYVFQVRASHPGGPWGAPPAELSIRVLPPPWRTGWAYAGYAAIVLLIAGSLVRAQVNKINERARAQRAVAQSEERLRLALWGSGDELWDWDMARGQITRLNRIGTETGGATTEALKSLDEIGKRVHPDDTPLLRQALDDHLSGQAPDFQVTCRISDGHDGWTWVIERGRVVDRDDDGQPTRITGTSKDISPLKAAEEALRELNEKLEERVGQRTEALQKANTDLTETIHRLRETQSQLTEAEKMASLGNLVAGVAHEINTPVGVSVTAASHLVEQTRRFARNMEGDDPRPEDVAAYQKACSACAELIMKNLERAAQLISSFKQVAVDQSSERRRAFDLKTYLGEILNSLHPRIDRSGHWVTVECPDGVSMNTFPGALYQVLSNLIINSLIHAFDEGVEGLIQITAVTVGDNAVRIVFRDNGRGMSDDVRSHIFEPFFTTRRGSGGSGLGMHIVFNLVTQALRGTIRCAEAPGGGALFELQIPRQLSEEKPTEASHDAA